MAAVLRRVDIVLQNNTNELLTVEGFALIRGEWGPPGAPRRGDVVEMQSSAQWCNLSTRDGIGAMGHMRLGCTKGYIDINWDLPWYDVSARVHQVTLPAALDHRLIVHDENQDLIAVLITLLPRPR